MRNTAISRGMLILAICSSVIILSRCGESRAIHIQLHARSVISVDTKLMPVDSFLESNSNEVLNHVKKILFTWDDDATFGAFAKILVRCLELGVTQYEYSDLNVSFRYGSVADWTVGNNRTNSIAVFLDDSEIYVFSNQQHGWIQDGQALFADASIRHLELAASKNTRMVNWGSFVKRAKGERDLQLYMLVDQFDATNHIPSFEDEVISQM